MSLVPRPPYPDFHTFGPHSAPVETEEEKQARAAEIIKKLETMVVAGKPKDAKTSVTAVRYNEGKRDWSLMPMGSVEEILKVLEFGKTKYSAWNWSKGDGFKYMDVYNSIMRHLVAWKSGEDTDPESGLSHIAHIGCNVLFLLHFINNQDKYPNNDDRHIV